MESWRARRGKAVDIVKEIIFFLLVTVVTYAWYMLVLLIISFITLSAIHFTIEAIFIISAAGTVVTDIFYAVSRVRKYRRNQSN